MKRVNEFNKKIRTSKKMPDLRSGYIVKVHRKIKEGNKERVQVFEGIVVAINAKQSSSPMLTVRRVSHGVGVEIVIPVFSPVVEKIEVIKKAKTRQAKLYYLREKDFKLSRLKMKELEQFAAKKEEEKPEEDDDKPAGKDSETKPEESNDEKSIETKEKPEKV